MIRGIGSTSVRLPDEGLALACHRLAGLTGCGASLSVALSSVAHDERDRRRRASWQRLADEVDGGVALSQALARQPCTFGPDMIARVRVAEADGSLPGAFADLERLAVQRAVHRARLRAALAYPMLAATALTLAMGFLLVRIVPLLHDGFGGDPGGVPEVSWHARPLLLASQALTDPRGVAGAAIGLAGLVGVVGWLTRSGQVRIGPGRVGRALELSRIAQTLAQLHAAGLPLDEALDVAARGCRAVRRRDALLSARARLSAGARLSDALAESRAVPDLFIRFVCAGEVAGTLDAALRGAAELHERDALRGLARSEALLGPVVLSIFGATLCWVIVSVLLPVYERALAGAPL